MHTYTTTASNDAHWMKLSVVAQSEDEAAHLFDEFLDAENTTTAVEEYRMARAIDQSATEIGYMYGYTEIECGKDGEMGAGDGVQFIDSGSNG